MDTSDKLLIGGIVVAGIIFWPQIKKTIGGFSDAASGVSDVVGSTGAIIGQTGANIASGLDFYKDNLFPPTALPNMLNKPAQTSILGGNYPNSLTGALTFAKTSAEYLGSGNLPNTSTPKGAVYTPPPVSQVASVNAPNTSTANGATYSAPPATFGVLSSSSASLNKSSSSSKSSGSKTTTSLNKNQILAPRAGGGYSVVGAKNIKLNK